MINLRINQIFLVVFLLLTVGILVFYAFKDDPATTEITEEAFDFNDEQYRLHNYLNDSTDHLVWFLQISDIHISEFHDTSRASDFETFCNETIKLIKPKVVLVTGDITDSKKQNKLGSDQYENEWKAYYSAIERNKILDTTVWLDIRGNHDNFNIPSLKSSNNFFSKYGIMGKFDRSYKYELNTPSGDKYLFIGVDACAYPGPRRPYNFFGTLNDLDITKLQSYAKDASSSNGTIWFGHFPTSTVNSRIEFRQIMSSGIAYLCGHLHTLGGILDNFYTRHTNGLLELELSDWKVNREIRLMAFDGGVFSFKDYYVKNKHIYILITNPKDLQFKSPREQAIRQVKHSTYIRILVFSKWQIRNVDVYIDGAFAGKARRANDSSVPLYILSWSPEAYKTHTHKIKVVAEDAEMNVESDGHEFSLDEKIMKPFPLLPTWLLFISSLWLTKSAFYTTLVSILLFLLFFRFYRKRMSVSWGVSCGFVRSCALTYLRRFVLLSSINYVFVSLLLMAVYVAIGPWFVGEIMDHHYGTCFIWGIYVKNTFLPADVQYMTGFFHLLFFQIPLILHLSFIIEQKFVSKETRKSVRHSEQSYPIRLLNFLWFNSAFIILLITNLMQMQELRLSYSLISVVICPFKTWFIIFAIYLRSRCFQLSEHDFEAFLQSKGHKIVNRIPSEFDDADRDDTK